MPSKVSGNVTIWLKPYSMPSTGRETGCFLKSYQIQVHPRLLKDWRGIFATDFISIRYNRGQRCDPYSLEEIQKMCDPFRRYNRGEIPRCVVTKISISGRSWLRINRIYSLKTMQPSQLQPKYLRDHSYITSAIFYIFLTPPSPLSASLHIADSYSIEITLASAISNPSLPRPLMMT